MKSEPVVNHGLTIRGERTYWRQFMDVFTSAHGDEEDQPDNSRNTTTRVH